MSSNDNIVTNEIVLFDVEDPILPPNARFTYNYYTKDERITDEASAEKMLAEIIQISLKCTARTIRLAANQP